MSKCPAALMNHFRVWWWNLKIHSRVFALKSVLNPNIFSGRACRLIRIGITHPDVWWVFSLSPSCSGFHVFSRVSQPAVLCLHLQAQQDHFQAYNPSPSAHPWSELAHFPMKNYRLYEWFQFQNFIFILRISSPKNEWSHNIHTLNPS